MLNRTTIIVGAIAGVTLLLGAVSQFLDGPDQEVLAKKAALDAAKLSASQIPVAAQCYDFTLANMKSPDANTAANTCKCLVAEVDKFGPAMRPALNSLVLIGLEASVETDSKSSRNNYVRSKLSKDKTILALSPEQHPILQTGINRVTKACRNLAKDT